MKSRKTFVQILLLTCCTLGSINVWSQKVTGTVYIGENEPAIGASIVDKAVDKGTITDLDGTFELNISGSTTLIVSYIGMITEEVEVSPGDQISITLESDASLISEVVVTASRTAVRKLVAPATVDLINAKRLESLKPESYNEALQNVPGVFFNPNQGRRNNVRLRGFPDGTPLGGMAYTAVLLDGIPALATPAKLPENGFAFDQNVERVELVKGSAATLYGRGAAAGVINLITRTGGEKLGGSVRVTNYNDILDEGGFNYRVDFNLNGPISKNIRFNVGGWQLNDRGFRNTGYNDEGFQLRGNVDFLFPENKGSIRVYGQYADFNFQNLTDVAVNANTFELADGWKNTDTYNLPNGDQINYRVWQRNRDLSWEENSVRNYGQALNDGSYANGYHAGLRIQYDLGAGFSIENHTRYQDMETGVKYGFALPAFYAANNVVRLLLDGDSRDQEIVNDFKILKKVQTGNVFHNFSAGVYFSSINLLPTTYSFFHGSSTDPNNLVLQHPIFGTPVNVNETVDFSFPPFPGAPFLVRFNGITRRGDYTEQLLAFSFGDEMKIGDNFNLLVGFRYDDLGIEMAETKFPADSTLTREENFADWSATIGMNYQLSDRSAIYGNINRTFRMPDYSAFTALEWTSATDMNFLRAPDGIQENEIIYNTELGYRNAIGDVSIEGAVFYTQINNRIAAIFEDGLLQSRPLGTNQIFGGEISLNYRPTWLKGLSLGGSFTYQNAVFTDFKIATTADPNGPLFGNTIVEESEGVFTLDLAGNQLPGTPEIMYNLMANYEHKYFGVDVGYNVVSQRYLDATNIYELPDLPILNLGVFGKIPFGDNTMRIGVQARNATNAQALVNIAGLADNDMVLKREQGDETLQGELAHGYIQLPRRILIYASYDF